VLYKDYLVKVLAVPISLGRKGTLGRQYSNYIGDSKANRMPYTRSRDYLNLIA